MVSAILIPTAFDAPLLLRKSLSESSAPTLDWCRLGCPSLRAIWSRFVRLCRRVDQRSRYDDPWERTFLVPARALGARHRPTG